MNRCKQLMLMPMRPAVSLTTICLSSQAPGERQPICGSPSQPGTWVESPVGVMRTHGSVTLAPPGRAEQGTGRGGCGDGCHGSPGAQCGSRP